MKKYKISDHFTTVCYSKSLFVVLVAQRYRSLPPHNKQKATGSILEAAPIILSWYGYSFVLKTYDYPVMKGQKKIYENNNHLKCKLI